MPRRTQLLDEHAEGRSGKIALANHPFRKPLNRVSRSDESGRCVKRLGQEPTTRAPSGNNLARRGELRQRSGVSREGTLAHLAFSARSAFKRTPENRHSRGNHLAGLKLLRQRPTVANHQHPLSRGARVHQTIRRLEAIGRQFHLAMPFGWHPHDRQHRRLAGLEQAS